MNDISRNNCRQRGVVRENIFDHDIYISPLPADASVTMAYVPFQTDTTMYDDARALSEGTLFPSLNKPLSGVGGCR